MAPRIVLIHAYLPAMTPIVEAFAKNWPEAEVLNVLDETLYADVGADGIMPPDMGGRVASLLTHVAASRADGIVFTGSTFGPVVDSAREGAAVPILKADEAMADEAVRRRQPILLVCTAKRALPVIHANLDAAAKIGNAATSVTHLWVEGAKDAISAGDFERHDRLIATAVEAADPPGIVVFGQISMIPSRKLLPTALAARVVTSAEASAKRMRALLQV